MPASQLCLLDNIRMCNGTEGLKNYYRGLLKNNKKKALELINDQHLKFGSLYHLRHECTDRSVVDSLNELYRNALEITSEVSGGMYRNLKARMRADSENMLSTLRWIISSGFDEDVPVTGFDRIMERSAALLTRNFKDTDMLPEIAEMIFRRNRNGRLIHEVVWAFFEACRPESLGMIAQRLNSTDSRDVGLSKKLLCFIPCISENDGSPGNILYSKAITWLHENLPFLYYTGESLHMSGQPLHYAVSTDAKYLCRTVSADNGELLSALNPFEAELLKHFNEMPEDSKKLLADFSYACYRTNFNQWYDWMQLPLPDQKAVAERYTGGLS